MTPEELTESERIEREEFARGHIAPDEEPVPPRPAATMVLVRRGGFGEGPDGPGPAEGTGDRAIDSSGPGFEVLLLKRPENARFAAGAYVFAGGVIDDEDAAADLRDRFGPGVTRDEPAALVAALRELFEETGLLPADEPPSRSERRRARVELLRNRTDFPTLVREWDLSFSGLRTVYLSRWVTPERLSRRYDARFFVTEHRGGEPELLGDELTGSVWLDPRTALSRFERGDLPMLFPTRKTLETFARVSGLEALLASAGDREVTPIRPRLLVREERVIPLMPSDPRYAEAG